MKALRYLLIVMAVTGPCAAATMHPPKPKKLTFKIVGITERIQKSGFSANRDVFLARSVDKNGNSAWVKIQYRYLGYEQEFPEELLSPEITHTFVAVRDRSCDESLQGVRTKFVREDDGRLTSVNVLRYLGSIPAADIPAEKVLPCFVIQPRTYRGSTRTKIPPPTSQFLQGE